MAKFGFFVGCLAATDIFSREMEEYLRLNGHKCLEIDVRALDKEMKRFAREHSKEPFSAVISFNNVGYSIGEEGEDFWEKMNIPFVDILVDHPFHFTHQLTQLSKNTRLYLVDGNHVHFVKKYFPNVEKVDFLMHAGCLFESLKAPEVENRDIDILYPGNLSRTIVENLIPDFGDFPQFDGAKLSEEVLSFLINNPDSLTEDVISSALRERGLSYSPKEELLIISAFRFIEGFAVSYFRELSVRILVENGFKVSVLGSGWEACDWAGNENLRILGRVSPPEVLSFMRRSRVVLNTMTWFKEGVHDRIFNAALCKSAVLSDSPDYIEGLLGKESVKSFDLKEIGKLPYLADDLISNGEYRESLVSNAYPVTFKEHTWCNRMELILKDLELL